jgi:spore maturation protein CgeB
MRIVMFYHSLVSDWNHGNAHFLRGVISELISRGHEVAIFEPRNGWSLENLLREHGTEPIRKFRAAYPRLNSEQYDVATLDLDAKLEDADLVVVHEWNSHELVRRIGEHRRSTGGYRLFFHDTHHRLLTEPKSMEAYELSNYDGVLAYGRVLRDLYLKSGRVERAWTWHEAADTRVFRAIESERSAGDLVWIGNWGDGERTAELNEFLIQPCNSQQLKAQIHGVRYPAQALQVLSNAGILYAGWLPNFDVPRVFGAFKFTVHIPRRPYVKALPGIPTIRVFEALACGIPLVSSPWEDSEGLFHPGKDFLVARNGNEMKEHLRALLNDPELGCELARRGRETIRARHTCAHRVDELLQILESLAPSKKVPALV